MFPFVQIFICSPTASGVVPPSFNVTVRDLRQDEAERRVTQAWGVREVCIVGSTERHRLHSLHAFSWIYLSHIPHSVKIGLKSLEVIEKTF